MTIHEPATVVTDLLLAGMGGYFALQLRRQRPEPQGPRRWWILAMISMAAGALVGGLYHGLAPELPQALELWWWRLVLWIVCGLGFTMAMSLLHELRPPGMRWWQLGLAGKSLIAAAVAGWHPEFVVAMVDYGLSMLAWAVAAMIVRRPWRLPMMGGVGLSVLAALVQQGQWGLSPWFNHNDVFHVIQALALMAFYKAGRLLD